MTNEQKQFYFNHGAHICPFCQDNNAEMETGDMQIDGTTAWQNCECASCGSDWQDVYELTDAVEV